ncbi:hypothetical protein PF003_g19979 [Phytophthora fragariae]|nr:hypothetical protein PF003_g19979 [Phytophthora fragariae]
MDHCGNVAAERKLRTPGSKRCPEASAWRRPRSHMACYGCPAASGIQLVRRGWWWRPRSRMACYGCPAASGIQLVRRGWWWRPRSRMACCSYPAAR